MGENQEHYLKSPLVHPLCNNTPLSSSSSKNPTNEQDSLTIKNEAQKAVDAVNKDADFLQGCKIIKNLCKNHSNSAYLRYVEAKIFETCASNSAELVPHLEDVFLKSGIKAARKSVGLAPNSIEFRYFLAYLIFQRSKDADGYNKAIQVCNHALAVENPSDPAEDKMESEDEIRIEDPEERICSAKDQFVCLINECKKKKVSLWWESLNTDEMLNFLNVCPLDLRSHFSSLDDNLANEVIFEPFLFFDEYKKWEFWECCCCDEKFPDSYKHLEHIWRIHFKRLSVKHSLDCSLRVDCDWINIITKGTWEPVDISAVREGLVEHWKLLSSTHNKSESDLEYSRNESFELIEYNPKRWARGYFFSLSYPKSQVCDSERATSLERIQNILQELLFNKALMAVHVNMVTAYAMSKLHGLLGVSPKEIGLDQTHLCICLLGAPQLKGICKFLLEISDRYNEIAQRKRNLSETFNTSSLGFDFYVRIGDSMPEESADVDHIVWGLPRGDAFSTWVFSCLSSEERLKEWTSLAEQRKHHWKCKVCEFQTILRKREAELVEFKKEKDISKDIQSVDTSQQETLNTGKDEGSGGLKFLADTCIEADNQENNDNNDLEISDCDAWNMQLSEYMNKWALELNSFAAADYREILFSLVKANIKARLEEIADNDGKEKSESAARQAGLATSKSSREDVDEVEPKLSHVGGTVVDNATEKSEAAKETVLASNNSDTETVRKHNSRDRELDADMEKAMRQSILEEELRRSKVDLGETVTKNNFEKMESEGCMGDATEKSEAAGEGELVDPKAGECHAETLRQRHSGGGEQPEAAEEGEQSEAAWEAEQVDPTVEECDQETLRHLNLEEIKHQADIKEAELRSADSPVADSEYQTSEKKLPEGLQLRICPC